LGVGEGMIFYMNRQAFLSRIHGRLFRHGPALEHTIRFQAKIVMQASGPMFLHDEYRPTVPLAGFGGRLRRFAEITFPSVCFQDHGVSPRDEALFQDRACLWAVPGGTRLASCQDAIPRSAAGEEARFGSTPRRRSPRPTVAEPNGPARRAADHPDQRVNAI